MKYGLLGKNLEHSFSKEIHKQFADYDYEYFELAESELDDFFLRDDLQGINVTIPYKKIAMGYCDELDPIAKRIGVVNVVIFSDKKIGYNTDYYGLMHIVKKANIEIEDKDVFILGDGSTSKTAHVVMEDMKAKSITHVTRGKSEVDYNNIYKYSPDILINTTPVGMYPNNLQSLVDLSKMRNLSGVVDVIYNPLNTKLIMDGKKLGLKTANGLDMLIEQGRKTTELFMNTKINNEKLKRAENKIRRRKTNLVLIGMPGSGKSELGYEISKRMGRKFVDIDSIIEKRFDSPKKIIENQGEDKFREIESKVTEEVGKLSEVVISTGGGIVLRDKNYYSLKQNGRIYYLDREYSDLSTKDRPLSQKASSLEDLYEERKDRYEMFTDKLITNEGRLDLTALKVVKDFYEN